MGLVTFLPSVIRGGNELPEDVRNSDNTTALRRCLNADLNLPPRHYNVGNRLGQILHSRLRNKCSSLKHHLFSKNIIQSHLCDCGAIGDSKHFFIDCPLYINLRQEMIGVISNLCTPTLNVLLMVTRLYRSTLIKQIFLAIQNYVIRSKRFQVNH